MSGRGIETFRKYRVVDTIWGLFRGREYFFLALGVGCTHVDGLGTRVHQLFIMLLKGMEGFRPMFNEMKIIRHFGEERSHPERGVFQGERRGEHHPAHIEAGLDDKLAASVEDLRTKLSGRCSRVIWALHEQDGL